MKTKMFASLESGDIFRIRTVTTASEPLIALQFDPDGWLGKSKLRCFNITLQRDEWRIYPATQVVELKHAPRIVEIEEYNVMNGQEYADIRLAYRHVVSGETTEAMIVLEQAIDRIHKAHQS